MINFEEVIERASVKKIELSQMLGIERTNINRTLRRFEKNLSEIDSFLNLLGTDLEKEISGGTIVSKNDNYDLIRTIKMQAETMLSQQAIIKSQQETIKAFTAQLQKRTA